MIQFVRVPEWGFSTLGDAWYYGRRWCIHIGPWLIFIWQMTDAEIEARDAQVEALRRRRER